MAILGLKDRSHEPGCKLLPPAQIRRFGVPVSAFSPKLPMAICLRPSLLRSGSVLPNAAGAIAIHGKMAKPQA